MMAIGALLLNHKLNNKPMGTSFIPLSAIIAVLIIAFLFASLPHVNHKTRYRVLHNDLYNLSISDLGTLNIVTDFGRVGIE